MKTRLLGPIGMMAALSLAEAGLLERKYPKPLDWGGPDKPKDKKPESAPTPCKRESMVVIPETKDHNPQAVRPAPRKRRG